MSDTDSKVILLVEDDPDDEALTRRALERNSISNPLVVVRDGAELRPMATHDLGALIRQLLVIRSIIGVYVEERLQIFLRFQLEVVHDELCSRFRVRVLC